MRKKFIGYFFLPQEKILLFLFLLLVLFSNSLPYFIQSNWLLINKSRIWILHLDLHLDPAPGSCILHLDPNVATWHDPLQMVHRRTAELTKLVEQTFCPSNRGADQRRKPPHEATVWSHHLLFSDYKLAMSHGTPSRTRGATPPPLEPGDNHVKTCKRILICTLSLNHKCERFFFSCERFTCT